MRQALEHTSGGTTYISAKGKGTVISIEQGDYPKALVRDVDYEDGTLIATLIAINVEDDDRAATIHEAYATGATITYEAQWWPNGTHEPGTRLDLTQHGETVLTGISIDRTKAYA